VALEIGYSLFGRVPDVLNGVVVGSIGWHRDEMDSFQEFALGQGGSDKLAFVEGGIIPTSPNPCYA
jgi:hypothetical protein